MNLYSQRHASPGPYIYVLPREIRSRILHTIKRLRMAHGFNSLIDQVGELLLARLGRFRSPYYEAARSSDDPVIEHFFSCTDEEALDFVVACFQTRVISLDFDGSCKLVEAINKVFEEEGLGYELTQPSTVDTGEKVLVPGFPVPANRQRTEFPKVIRKDERTLHETAVRPAMESLRDSRFATANGELLDAFQKVRDGSYADAITSCGAAFESVLKTICNARGWAYDPNKDTCAKLISICRDEGLFYPLYAPILEGVGTVRNKLGDAHGKGPKPLHVAESEHADHMIAVTCAHIEFLIQCAKLGR